MNNLHLYSFQKPQSSACKDPALSKLNRFCRDSRCLDQWVPVINLPERWWLAVGSYHETTQSYCTVFVYTCLCRNPGLSLHCHKEDDRRGKIDKMQGTRKSNPPAMLIRSMGIFFQAQRGRHEQEAWLSRVLAMFTKNEQLLPFRE